MQVQAGQQLGTHVGNQTWSEVAVTADSPVGRRLVSYFEALTDAAFDPYRARGIGARGDAVISREGRDASPLTCSGETITDKGTLENWIVLR